jgi:predicted secreted protein
MPRRILVLNLILGACMLLGAGCVDSVDQPKAFTTLVLKPAQREVAVKMRLAQGLKLLVPRPQGGAGFEWQVVANTEDVLQQLTPLYPMHGAPEPGPDGVRTVSFATIDEGKSVLRLASLRPDTMYAEPTDYYEITVTVRP